MALSNYDQARKKLKAKGVKTPQLCTKAALITILRRNGLSPLANKMAAEAKSKPKKKTKKPAKKKVAKRKKRK